MTNIDLLELVLKATQKQKLIWEYVEPDRYTATDKYPYIIHFVQIPTAEGNATCVSLIYVLLAGVQLTVTDSSPEAEIIEQILAVNHPEWAETIHFMKIQRAEVAERLIALIGDD